MAVIQDLPPELLDRILELVAIPSIATQGESVGPTFRQAALVARAWRAPAQRLLASTFRFNTWRTQTYRKILEVIASPHGSPAKQLGSLIVVVTETSAHELALLQRQCVEVQQLCIVGAGKPLGALHARLISGLRCLKLYSSAAAAAVGGGFATPTPMMLQTLSITSDLTEIPSFLLPFATSAPRLSRLELFCRHDALRSTLQAGLVSLANRLTQLQLTVEQEALHSLPCLDAFLAACTSVVTLDLNGVAPSITKRILALLPSPLTLLTISNLRLETLCDRMPDELAEAFDLPSMSKLKRWRIESSPSFIDGGETDWNAACRARGVEPRGDERYFTD